MENFTSPSNDIDDRPPSPIRIDHRPLRTTGEEASMPARQFSDGALFDPNPLAGSLLLALHPEVSIDRGDERTSRLLTFPWGKCTISDVTNGISEALRVLATQAVTEDEVSRRALEADGAEGLEQLQFRLRRLSALRLLTYTLRAEGKDLATVEPMTLGFRFTLSDVNSADRFKISRFTYCRSHKGGLVLESPLSLVRIRISDHRTVAVLTELTEPRAHPDLRHALGGVSDTTAEAFVSLLRSTGFISAVDATGNSAEDKDAALTQWEFHDLLFHSRSRPGRHDYVACGDFRFLNKVLPLPAVKSRMSDEVIPLEKPCIDELMNDDPPFTQVLEQRRSIRRQGDDPINSRQLGEFLYRTARVRKVFDIDPIHRLHYEASSRPYPTAGGTYELELYVVIHKCAGINAGLYHYRPGQHDLERLPDSEKRAAALLRDAQIAAYLPVLPQVLIVITSRFPRVSWKYSGIAYALTLKNTGVLYQTMYLVAEAMGLAPCALGGGDPSFLGNAVGTDYWSESSVGEFLLGSRSR